MDENWTTPSWISEALASRVEPTFRPQQPRSTVSPGDVYVVDPMDGNGERRVVVVLDVGLGWADVGLIHTEPELATDSDVVLSTTESPSGYPLVIQFDVTGPVFFCQLEAFLGNLTPEAAALTDAATAAKSIGSRRGMPIRSRQDPRRAHKVSELRSLQALAKPCSAQIIDGVRDDDFDPELLLAAQRGSEDAMRYLVNAASFRDRTASIVAEALVGDRALAVDQADPMSLELMNALGAFLMPSRPRIRQKVEATFVDGVISEGAVKRALAATAAAAASGGSSCVFLTSGKEFWPGILRSDRFGTLTVEVRGKRVQLVGVFHDIRPNSRRKAAA